MWILCTTNVDHYAITPETYNIFLFECHAIIRKLSSSTALHSQPILLILVHCRIFRHHDSDFQPIPRFSLDLFSTIRRSIPYFSARSIWPTYPVFLHLIVSNSTLSKPVFLSTTLFLCFSINETRSTLLMIPILKVSNLLIISVLSVHTSTPYESTVRMLHFASLYQPKIRKWNSQQFTEFPARSSRLFYKTLHFHLIIHHLP